MTEPLFSYMGTKRYLAKRVARLLTDVATDGAVVDLFAGSGAVSIEVALAGMPIIANDISHFICGLQRPQILKRSSEPRVGSDVLLGDAGPRAAKRAIRYQGRIVRDRRAIESGPDALRDHMDRVPNPELSEYLKAKYRSSRAIGVPTYDMTVDYFGSRYFSTAQAIMLDALRETIDARLPESRPSPEDRIWSNSTERDVAIAAWLLAAISVSNTTGHGAQYLRSTSKGFDRVVACWGRSVEHAFSKAYVKVMRNNALLASSANMVSRLEAEKFFETGFCSVSAAYADPPYTKDHYSRMYHLYETMYLYDQPHVMGVGLARTDRYYSDFCYKSRAPSAIAQLIAGARGAGCSLLLSYPRDAVMRMDQASWQSLASSVDACKVLELEERPVSYSTLGASKGHRDKDSQEQLFLVR